jgi:hypothetical protein
MLSNSNLALYIEKNGICEQHVVLQVEHATLALH